LSELPVYFNTGKEPNMNNQIRINNDKQDDQTNKSTINAYKLPVLCVSIEWL